MKSLISKILKEELNKSIINRIGGNDKIHISKDDNLKFRNIPVGEQSIGGKPKGLWFSFGTQWIDFIGHGFLDKEEVDSMLKNTYKIITDDSKILTIGKENEREFLKKYGVDNKYGNIEVDWGNVSSDWDGIETIINPRELSNMWLWSTWDVASGCIWNVGGIKSISKL